MAAGARVGDAGLWPLLAAMEAFAPGVRGSVRAPSPDEIAPGRNNRAALARLVESVRGAHPEAGRQFWSVRSWSLIVWQPAALAVLGVHVAGLVPDLERIAVGDGGSGFSFPSERVERGAPPDILAIAGGRLRARADGLLSELSSVVPVKRRLAERLLADRVLGTLAVLAAHGLLSAEAAQAAAGRWLAAMALEGASGLVCLTLGDGRRQPALDRRACCLEFRVADGALCPSCPKLPAPERFERMRRYWEDHPRPS